MGSLIATCGIWAIATAYAFNSPLDWLPSHLGIWEKGKAAVYDRGNIFDFVDGAGEIYLAYDFQKVYVQEYETGSGSRIAVEIYETLSPGDAYGLLSIDLTGEPVRIGTIGLYGSGLLRFWKWRYYVRILAERETSESKSAIMELGRRISDSIKEEAPIPKIVQIMPSYGLVKNSTCYFHKLVVLNSLFFISQKNILGLSERTEAVLADYRVGKRVAKALLVSYPNTKEPYKAYRSFTREILKARDTGRRCVRRVGPKSFYGAGVHGRYLFLVLEAPTRSACLGLLMRIYSRVRSSR